jgi:hypothetical protein
MSGEYQWYNREYGAPTLAERAVLALIPGVFALLCLWWFWPAIWAGVRQGFQAAPPASATTPAP